MKNKDVHEIVSELKRLAAELGHTPTRAEFEKHSEITIHKVKAVFGAYISAISAAGLPTHPYTNKRLLDQFGKNLERQIVKKSDFDRLMAKVKEEITPYAGKYVKRPSDCMTLLVMSDLHSEWVDPFCLRVAEDVAKRIKPDIINFAGDIADFYEVSRFSKDPERRHRLQDEIDFVSNEMFARFRKAAPDAQIDFLLGNHELRLFKYLCDHPGLSSLRALQFNELFELDKHKMNLIARKSFLTNVKKSANFIVYDNSFVVFHGSSLGRHHASSQLHKWGKSGTSGHVHKYQVFTDRNLHGNKFWVSLGTMANYELAEEYVEDLANWTQGFMVVHIRNGGVIAEYVDCSNEFATYAGKFYLRK